MKVDIRRRQRVLDDFFQVDAFDFSFERFDGTMSEPTRRLVLERGDSVAAVLYDRERERCILIEQYRIATAAKGPGWMIEAVAGMVDRDETPEAALRREVHEETGYRIDALLPIADFYLSPGGSSERVFLYAADVDAASRVGSGGGLAAEGEDIRLVEYTPQELRQALAERRIVDAKTLVGAMWLLASLDGKAR